MDTPPLVRPPLPAYQDRRTGLKVFGILEIILGAFCALMLPLMVLGQVIAAKQNATAVDFALAAPALLTFSALAVGLVWLGIGSMQARRWARALLLCLGWMGLCVGLCSLAVMIPTLGSMGEMMRQQGREAPSGAIAFAKIFIIATITVIYVLIPGAMVLFYRSVNVKLTCEACDPAERWTDRCPLPVLAMCILQASGAIYVVLMPRFGAAMPLAGFLVTGWLARIVWFGFAGLSAYAAWGFYRLKPSVWLLYTIAIVVFGLSSTVTFLRIDLLDYYRAVGMPESQIKQIAVSPLVHGHMIVWMTGFGVAFFGGYLLYLRRYFLGTNRSSVTPSAGQFD